jgi:DNA-binding IclR family transcriptional regulator
MSVPRTQSLTRAIALLRAMQHFPRGVTTAELARVTDLPPATAGRLLATLQDAGFADRGGEGWSIGPELVRIAQRAEPRRDLARRAQPVLAQLASAAKESAMLGVPRGRTRVVVVAQADGPRLLGITNWIGRPIDDLHASAAGKLLLAELDDRAVVAWLRRVKPPRFTARTLAAPRALLEELARVREQGWAEIDGESEPGLASVAVPVREAGGGPLAGMLGYSGPSERLDRDALVAPLQRAASALAGQPNVNA